MFHLFFADDQIVIAKDEDDIYYMIEKFKEESVTGGFRINMFKCELLVVKDNDIKDPVLGAEKIKGMEN